MTGTFPSEPLNTMTNSVSRVCDSPRIRHPAGHHGEGGAEQLAGQRHLRGKLQRRQLPAPPGGSGPEAGEEVRDRPRGREAAEHAGAGDATMTQHSNKRSTDVFTLVSRSVICLSTC